MSNADKLLSIEFSFRQAVNEDAAVGLVMNTERGTQRYDLRDMVGGKVTRWSPTRQAFFAGFQQLVMDTLAQPEEGAPEPAPHPHSMLCPSCAPREPGDVNWMTNAVRKIHQRYGCTTIVAPMFLDVSTAAALVVEGVAVPIEDPPGGIEHWRKTITDTSVHKISYSEADGRTEFVIGPMN